MFTSIKNTVKPEVSNTRLTEVAYASFVPSTVLTHPDSSDRLRRSHYIRSTAVATASRSTIKGKMRVL